MDPVSSLFSHAATILHVKDPRKSAVYYRDKLGFNITFEWNEPPDYVVTNRNNVYIHFSKTEQPDNDTKHRVYIFVRDLDLVRADLESRGADFKIGSNENELHINDFDIIDPDGNIITFGSDS